MKGNKSGTEYFTVTVVLRFDLSLVLRARPGVTVPLF